MATANPMTEPAVLRGVRLDDIPVPPEVTAFLDQGGIPHDDERGEWERLHTLSFLYGGKEVACRETDAWCNWEVLHAADGEEMVRWRETITDEQRGGPICFLCPRSWELVLWDAGIRPKRRWWHVFG
jgi:hypothetical protein